MVGISGAAMRAAADDLGVEVAVIHAVVAVETGRVGGFLDDGRLVALFEAHIFHRRTNGRFTGSHPHISSKAWNRSLYRGAKGEWDRIEEAKRLDAKAALESASWGAFQILGLNHKACGFNSVEAFVASLQTSIDNHLSAFVAFVKSHSKLHEALKGQDWAAFAKGYNGPGYAANKYDSKLATEFARARAQLQGDPDGKVKAKAVQVALNVKQGAGLLVDGYAGPKTREAIAKVQESLPVPVTGTLDTTTQQALGLPIERLASSAKTISTAVTSVATAATPLLGVDWRLAAVLVAAILVGAAGYLGWRWIRLREARL